MCPESTGVLDALCKLVTPIREESWIKETNFDWHCPSRERGLEIIEHVSCGEIVSLVQTSIHADRRLVVLHFKGAGFWRQISPKLDRGPADQNSVVRRTADRTRVGGGEARNETDARRIC